MKDDKECPRILIIEDDADHLVLMRDALSLHYGSSVEANLVAAASAAEALAQDPSAFDVVLLDYYLPDMPGLDLLRELLSRAEVPVILVTGLNDSATAAEALRIGAQDYIVKLGDYLFALPVLIDKNIEQYGIRRENARLQREQEATLSELHTKNAQLEDSLRRLEQMATTDHLTGLANRRRFGEILPRYYAQAVRYEHDLACCMADLDNYKQINDTRGHQAGDELLVLTAGVINSSLRASDVAARYGGDEFVMLLPHTSVERGHDVAERIRHELKTRSMALWGSSGVTLSVGIASLAACRPDSAEQLVTLADRALYEAKQQGRDRIVTVGRPAEAAV